MNFLKLHKSGAEVWINFDHVVRLDIHKDGTHVDFTDAGLEEVVDETLAEILALTRSPTYQQ